MEVSCKLFNEGTRVMPWLAYENKFCNTTLFYTDESSTIKEDYKDIFYVMGGQ